MVIFDHNFNYDRRFGIRAIPLRIYEDILLPHILTVRHIMYGEEVQS